MCRYSLVLLRYYRNKQLTMCDQRSSEPGAARWGNFINYYQFNPTAKRLCHLPKDLLKNVLDSKDLNSKEPILCLDVGCNSGDLSRSLYSHFSEETGRPLQILGVDIDQNLVQIAEKKYTTDTEESLKELSFLHLDLSQDACEADLERYLNKFDRDQFDLVFCFSVSMWIHLNHGDQGLKTFFERIAKFGKSLVLEPQPWKCYRNASRRMRKLNLPDFEKIDTLEHQGEAVLTFIHQICLDSGFEKVSELGQTHWSRPIWVYKQKTKQS